MSDLAGSLAPLLFWTLASGALIAPRRWSLFCYLLLTQVDLSAADFSSASSVGWDNAFRVVVIPTVLLLRFRSKTHIPTISTALSRWWPLFVADVAIAAIWSPFPLSALKMLGYLYCYSALFILFRRAWAESWFRVRFVIANLCAALCIAVAQSYFLGDFPRPEGRLTSFDDPQNFAAYLISIAAIVWFSNE